MDISIKIGSMKCLVILGVPTNKKIKTLRYKDMEPIIVKPVECCTGEVIEEALREAEKKTGVPDFILSDEGSEIKRGVTLYNKKVKHIFDIVHKIDKTLVRELKEDKDWIEFSKQMTQTVQSLKLTKYAYLIPPKRRSKDRLLSQGAIIKWSQRVIKLLERTNNIVIKHKLQWVRKYPLREYLMIWNISLKACQFVRQNGYYKGMEKDFKIRTFNKRTEKYYQKVKQVLKEEGNKTKKPCFGSTEVLESTFGKFKNLEKRQGGFTSLILSIAAMAGKITKKSVEAALKNIKIQDVWDWIKENLGETFYSKRRRDLKV